MGTTAVPNLIARYAELVDSGDFAGVGELFAEAVFIGSGEPAEGAAAVERMLRDTVIRYEDGTPRTHHAVSNLAVEVDEESGSPPRVPTSRCSRPCPSRRCRPSRLGGTRTVSHAGEGGGGSWSGGCGFILWGM